MKFFNKKFFFIVLTFLLLAISQNVFAQTGGETGVITSVSNFSVHPYAQENNLFQNYPGVCVMADFQNTQNTQVALRFAPYSSDAESLDWTYGNPISITPNSGINLTALAGISPATEYVVEIMEFVNGEYFSITPDNYADSLALVCSPNANGQMSGDCQIGAPVYTICSPTGMLPNEENNPYGYVTISNTSSTENSFDFDVAIQNIPEPQTLRILYTTNQNIIIDGTFTGANYLTTDVVSSGQTVSLSIPGLLASTTYYITVLNVDNQIVLGGGQPYQTFTTSGVGTGANNSPNQTNNPIDININIDTSNPPELAGENINQGLVQCGFGEIYDCDFNKLLETVDRVLKFLIYILVLPIAAILFAIAGIKLIIARQKGKEAAMSDAKTLFGNVVVGLALALGAWVIVKFLLVILGYTDASGVLTQILGITTTP